MPPGRVHDVVDTGGLPPSASTCPPALETMTFDDDGDLRPLRTERVLPERPLVAPDQVEDALRRPAVPSA